MRDYEARSGGPWVRSKTAIATQQGKLLSINGLERKTELRLQLVLPLANHAGGSSDNDKINTAAKQHLAKY